MESADNNLPAIDQNSLSELSRNVAETAQVLFTAGGVTETLSSVVHLAVATIDGCDFAGIFLLHGDVVTTPAHTDPLVIEADSLQHRSGEGPCLDAITHRLVF